MLYSNNIIRDNCKYNYNYERFFLDKYNIAIAMCNFVFYQFLDKYFK